MTYRNFVGQLWVLARQGYDRADLLGRESRRRAWTRRVSQAFRHRRFLVRAAPAIKPMADSLGPDAKLARNLTNRDPRCRQQDQLCPLSQLLWRRMGAHQLGQNLLLKRSGDNGCGRQT
jgi:hypothetical protein